MKKIVFVGLINDTNLGDKIIADCTKHIFLQQEVDIQAVDLDLMSTKTLFNSIINKIFSRFFPAKCLQTIINKSSKLYKSSIKDADCVVMVGGGMIKYKYQGLTPYVCGLIKAAMELNIPIVLNSVGVEGYSDTDVRCRILKKYLNSSTVMAITTRDDFELLTNKWLEGNSRIYTKLVADSAVWANEVYGIEKNETSQVIGVGLIRGEIFRDYNIDFSKKEVIELYSSIIEELERRNIQYKLFTNGFKEDYDLAKEVCENISRIDLIDEIYHPKDSKELVAIISEFRGVIAARLHACIISYSLEIPVIGLTWNDKLPLFGTQIGYRERFIESDNFKAKIIVDKLEKSLQENYNQGAMLDYKMRIKDSIKEILLLLN